MTDPANQLTPPAPQALITPEVTIATGMAPGPDGKPWVTLAIGIGQTVFQLIVPDNQASELATIISKNLELAAANVRRAKLGLIVPAGPNPIVPPNGRRP